MIPSIVGHILGTQCVLLEMHCLVSDTFGVHNPYDKTHATSHHDYWYTSGYYKVYGTELAEHPQDTLRVAMYEEKVKAARTYTHFYRAKYWRYYDTHWVSWNQLVAFHFCTHCVLSMCLGSPCKKSCFYADRKQNHQLLAKNDLSVIYTQFAHPKPQVQIPWNAYKHVGHIEFPQTYRWYSPHTLMKAQSNLNVPRKSNLPSQTVGEIFNKPQKTKFSYTFRYPRIYGANHANTSKC